VTNVGEGGTAMLAEALRIRSTLWSSPALSDCSRVLGLIQLLIEVGIRSVGNIKDSFSDGVIAEWQTATAGRSRRGLQAQRDLHLAFVDRLICETSLGTADREELMAFCNRTLHRCLIS
jgi:hypothetical protein